MAETAFNGMCVAPDYSGIPGTSLCVSCHIRTRSDAVRDNKGVLMTRLEM